MTKEKLKHVLKEGDQSKATKLLTELSTIDSDKTYILIISSLSDLSFKEDQSDYQNALILLDSIGYSAKSLATTLKGWNLFAQYGFTETDNAPTLVNTSAASDSNPMTENALEEYPSNDETDHSTSFADNSNISGDAEEFFTMDD